LSIAPKAMLTMLALWPTRREPPSWRLRLPGNSRHRSPP
jgi:hypothetical protein